MVVQVWAPSRLPILYERSHHIMRHEQRVAFIIYPIVRYAAVTLKAHQGCARTEYAPPIHSGFDAPLYRLHFSNILYQF